MAAEHSFPVTVLNPFEARELPLSLKVYRFGYSPYRSRLERTLLRIPVRYAFRKLLGAGRGAAFGLRIHHQGDFRELLLNGGNLQYHSVYLPQHAPLYESEVSASIALLAPHTHHFWDIGANWGHHSLQVLLNPVFMGDVTAFEPNAVIAEELRRVLAAVDMTARAKVNSFGLGATLDRKYLRFPDGIHSGLASVVDEHGGPIVDIRSADALDLAAPDLMKLDVEGYEINCLKGAMNILRSAKPTLIIELWSADPRSVDAHHLLRRLGYRIFEPKFAQKAASGAGGREVTGMLSFTPLPVDFAQEKVNALAVHPEGVHAPIIFEPA